MLKIIPSVVACPEQSLENGKSNYSRQPLLYRRYNRNNLTLLPGKYDTDTLLTHTCNSGYYIDGPKQRICLPIGIWEVTSGQRIHYNSPYEAPTCYNGNKLNIVQKLLI